MSKPEVIVAQVEATMPIIINPPEEKAQSEQGNNSAILHQKAIQAEVIFGQITEVQT